MKPEIIDNFLDDKTFNEIKNFVMGHSMHWHFNDYIATENEKSEQFYFTHKLYEDGEIISPFFSKFKPIFDKLNMNKHIRSKLNCYLRSDELQRHSKHIDQVYPCKGFILPFNTNDGLTEFDNCVIKTIANRGFKFNPNISHNSTNCTNAKVRININVNYL